MKKFSYKKESQKPSPRSSCNNDDIKLKEKKKISGEISPDGDKKMEK